MLPRRMFVATEGMFESVSYMIYVTRATSLGRHAGGCRKAFTRLRRVKAVLRPATLTNRQNESSRTPDTPEESHGGFRAAAQKKHRHED